MTAKNNSSPEAGNEKAPSPYVLQLPPAEAGPPLWLITSPHSGSYYPPEFIRRSRLDSHRLRLSEDAHIDQLLDGVPEKGAGLLKSTYPRAYVDLNREPYELDPEMFSDSLPNHVNRNSRRVQSGLGTIAKVVADGLEIYAEKIPFSDAEARINTIYFPFHDCLKGQLEAAKNRWGMACLLDVHSMPSNAVGKFTRKESGNVDFVLGDCHGQSCDGEYFEAVCGFLTSAGCRVEKNKPYAGGHITRHYGNPANGFHALQLEVNRNLYMDESSYELTGNAEALKNLFTELVSVLADKAVEKLPKAAE